jgi:alpha-ketoglutarate-dependent taurine dioxygenase
VKIVMKNWVGYIEDFSVNDVTDEEIQIIGNLIADATVVVIPGVKNLTPLEEHNFTSRFGKHDLFDEVKNKYPKFYDSIMTDYPEAPSIARVTGALNDEGLPGLHGGAGDLDWHCNKPHMPQRMPIVYLRSIKGSVGSRTSWINGVLAYNDLPEEWKQRLEGITLRTTSSYGNYSEIGEVFGLQETISDVAFGYKPPMISINSKGHKAIYFPFLQMRGLIGVKDKAEEDEILQYVQKHMMQEKYMFHHDWQDGDINFSDQWSGIHKRWAFAGMKTRLLHRIVFTYDNIRFT